MAIIKQLEGMFGEIIDLLKPVVCGEISRQIAARVTQIAITQSIARMYPFRLPEK